MARFDAVNGWADIARSTPESRFAPPSVARRTAPSVTVPSSAPPRPTTATRPRPLSRMRSWAVRSVSAGLTVSPASTVTDPCPPGLRRRPGPFGSGAGPFGLAPRASGRSSRTRGERLGRVRARHAPGCRAHRRQPVAIGEELLDLRGQLIRGRVAVTHQQGGARVHEERALTVWWSSGANG